MFQTLHNRVSDLSGVQSCSYFDGKNWISNSVSHEVSILEHCNIRIYYLDKESSLEEAENSLVCKFDGLYYSDKVLLGYSEYTILGYEMSSCHIGGHDLISEISCHIGEYIIFVLEH